MTEHNCVKKKVSNGGEIGILLQINNNNNIIVRPYVVSIFDVRFKVELIDIYVSSSLPNVSKVHFTISNI